MSCWLRRGPNAAPSASLSARRIAAIAASLALFAVGCDDDETIDEAGRLGFAYSTAEGRIASSTPLAVGSRASVVLQAEPGLAFGAITSAASLDPEVIDVVQTEPGFVLVEALAPGAAEVEITALVGEDGDFVRDTLTIETLDAESVSIALGCATSDGVGLLESSRVQLPFEMKGPDGTELTGWGFYPIEVAPADALELDPQASATTRLPLVTTDYLGQVDVSSPLGGEPLALEVVGEEEIESAFLEGGAEGEVLVSGSARDLRVVPIVRGESLCQGEPERTLEVQTPSTCSVEPSAARGAIDPASFLRFEGLAPGVCRFVVRYPRAAGGQGLALTFELDVVPPS